MNVNFEEIARLKELLAKYGLREFHKNELEAKKESMIRRNLNKLKDLKELKVDSIRNLNKNDEYENIKKTRNSIQNSYNQLINEKKNYDFYTNKIEECKNTHFMLNIVGGFSSALIAIIIGLTGLTLPALIAGVSAYLGFSLINKIAYKFRTRFYRPGKKHFDKKYGSNYNLLDIVKGKEEDLANYNAKLQQMEMKNINTDPIMTEINEYRNFKNDYEEMLTIVGSTPETYVNRLLSHQIINNYYVKQDLSLNTHVLNLARNPYNN